MSELFSGKLGVIVYNAPHLKSEQTLFSLYRHGYRNVVVYALPFVERKKREVLFAHRPDQSMAAHPRDICALFEYPFVPVAHDSEIDNSCDLYLIAGAGILSPEAVSAKSILNIHPGVIPAARGLDAFKWSIYYMRPIGITLHYIDEHVDMGEVISIVPTPVFASDSLASFARRHYENEMHVISNFAYHLIHRENPYQDIPSGESMRRMPLEIEKTLPAKFEEYKKKFADSPIL